MKSVGWTVALALLVGAGTMQAEPCEDAVLKAGVSGSAMARCMAPERSDVAVLACTELILSCQRAPRWLEQLHVSRASAHLQNYLSSGDKRSVDAALKDCAFVLSFHPDSGLAYSKRGDVYKAEAATLRRPWSSPTASLVSPCVAQAAEDADRAR